MHSCDLTREQQDLDATQGTLLRKAMIERQQPGVLGPELSKIELIFTLEHGLGPWRVAEASSWRPTAHCKVTAPPETKTLVISCNTPITMCQMKWLKAGVVSCLWGPEDTACQDTLVP